MTERTQKLCTYLFQIAERTRGNEEVQVLLKNAIDLLGEIEEHETKEGFSFVKIGELR